MQDALPPGPLHYVDPLSLHFFVRASELGTIGLAAQAEQIAASAISKRISELEAFFGTALIHRSRSGVAPTPTGQLLLRHSRQLLQNYRDLYGEMHAHASGAAGRIEVLANISAMADFVPDAVAAFMAEHPRVEVLLHEQVSSDIVRAVAEGRADLGICREIALSDGVHSQLLRTSQFVALVPQQHPLAGRASVDFSETLGHPQLSISHNSSVNELMVRIAQQMGTPLRFRIQVFSFDAALRVIRAGLALGILPRELLDVNLRDGLVAVPLRDAWARQRLVLCTRRLDTLGAAARRLNDHLLAWPVNKDAP